MPSAVDSDKTPEKTREQQKMEALYKDVPDLKRFFVLRKQIGEGTFSTVYMAQLRNSTNPKKFAVKHLVPTCHPQRMRLELKCLKMIGGSNNVVGIDICIRRNNNLVFITSYLDHEPFAEYYDRMDAAELRLYLKNLLIAVARVHKFGVIHRDIKPSNFLYNRTKKEFLLVDFGLAQITVQNTNGSNNKRKRESDGKDDLLPSKRLMLKTCAKQVNNSDQENIPINNRNTLTEIMLKDKKQSSANNCNCYGRSTICSICLTRKPLVASRAGTPGFRPPEVLLKVANQTTAIDIWAVGIIFMSLLSHTCNFFTSPDDLTALAEMITVFGTERMRRIAYACNRHLVTSENLPGFKLENLCNALRNRDDKPMTVYPKAAYELLEKLLELDPNKRITAEKALEEQFLR